METRIVDIEKLTNAFERFYFKTIEVSISVKLEIAVDGTPEVNTSRSHRKQTIISPQLPWQIAFRKLQDIHEHSKFLLSVADDNLYGIEYPAYNEALKAVRDFNLRDKNFVIKIKEATIWSLD